MRAQEEEFTTGIIHSDRFVSMETRVVRREVAFHVLATDHDIKMNGKVIFQVWSWVFTV